ncbi:hypothetical protein NL676_039263 [Syzygium grande]|nr:hypothetical protein NL676_039263 [Syzygium grande]
MSTCLPIATAACPIVSPSPLPRPWLSLLGHRLSHGRACLAAVSAVAKLAQSLAYRAQSIARMPGRSPGRGQGLCRAIFE